MIKVHLFGNCQTAALSKMMLEDHPEWSVTVMEIGSAGDDRPATVRWHGERVAEADIIISQPVTAWKGVGGLSLAAIQSARRPTSQLITFPSIVFEGTHAAFTYMHGRLPGFHMPYHNTHTVDMFARRYRHADILLLQNAPDFYTREFVAAGMEASLAELRFREASNQTTISVADIASEACWSKVLMNSINHPGRFLLARTLNEIYCTISERPSARETGEDYLPEPWIPPLPTVLAHLGIPDLAPDYVIADRRFTRDEYLTGSLAYYARLLRPDLLSALSKSRGHEFLAAFHQSTTALEEPTRAHLGEISAYGAEWVRCMYLVFLKREPTPSDIATHVQGLLEIGVGAWLAAFASLGEFRSMNREQTAADETPVFALRRVPSGRTR